MGRDRPDISEGLTEAARVAIGIVVGLTIAFTIAIISLCLVRISTLLSVYRIAGASSETFLVGA